jgi:hypothetical protein
MVFRKHLHCFSVGCDEESQQFQIAVRAGTEIVYSMLTPIPDSTDIMNHNTSDCYDNVIASVRYRICEAQVVHI